MVYARVVGWAALGYTASCPIIPARRRAPHTRHAPARPAAPTNDERKTAVSLWPDGQKGGKQHATWAHFRSAWPSGTSRPRSPSTRNSASGLRRRHRPELAHPQERRRHHRPLFRACSRRNILAFNPGWDANAQQVDGFTDIRETSAACAAGRHFQSEAGKAPPDPPVYRLLDPDGNPVLVDSMYKPQPQRAQTQSTGAQRGTTKILRLRSLDPSISSCPFVPFVPGQVSASKIRGRSPTMTSDRITISPR